MEFWHSVAIWFIIFLTYSFAGWIIEIINTIYRDHKIYNRGFLIGPICPIYGVGCCIVSFLLGNIDNIAAIFCVAMVGGAILEYLTSLWMEQLFHVRWWDYSDRKFNVDGRICAFNIFLFGLAGIIVVHFIQPWLIATLYGFDKYLITIIAGVLFIIYLADNICSLGLILKFKVTAGTVSRDATEEITENIRRVFLENGEKLRSRLMNAFPDLEVKKITERKKPRKTSKNPKNRI